MFFSQDLHDYDEALGDNMPDHDDPYVPGHYEADSPKQTLLGMFLKWQKSKVRSSHCLQRVIYSPAEVLLLTLSGSSRKPQVD